MWRVMIKLVILCSLVNVADFQSRTRVRTGQSPSYHRRPVAPAASRQYTRTQYGTTGTANTLRRMEAEMSRMKLMVNSMENNLRVTLSATLQQRLGTVMKAVETNSNRIRESEVKIQRLEEEISVLRSSSGGIGASSSVLLSEGQVPPDLYFMRKSIEKLEGQIANITSKKGGIQELTGQIETLESDHTYLKGIASTASILSPKVDELERMQTLQEAALKNIEGKLAAQGGTSAATEDISMLKQRVAELAAQNQDLVTSTSVLPPRVDELERKQSLQEAALNDIDEKLADHEYRETVAEEISMLKQSVAELAAKNKEPELPRLNFLFLSKMETNFEILNANLSKQLKDIKDLSNRTEVQEKKITEREEQLSNLLSSCGVCQTIENKIESHISPDIAEHRKKLERLQQNMTLCCESATFAEIQYESLTDSLEQMNSSIAKIMQSYNPEYEEFQPDFEVYPRTEDVLGEPEIYTGTMVREQHTPTQAYVNPSTQLLTSIETRLTYLESKTAELDKIGDKTFTLDNARHALSAKLNESIALLTNQQKAIKNLTSTFANATKRMDNFTSAFAIVRTAFKRVETRDSEHTSAINSNRRRLEAMVATLRKIEERPLTDRRQNTAIGNLRRRIRTMENYNFDLFVEKSELESVRANVSDTVAHLQEEVTSLKHAALADDEITEPTESTPNQQVAVEIANMNHILHEHDKAIFFLRNQSNSVAVLESEFKSYVTALQAVPQMKEDIKGLIKLRNLALKNSGDINRLHEFYEEMNSDVMKLQQQNSDAEFLTKNLQISEKELRSDIEESLNLYNRLSSSHIELKNKLVLFTYSTEINATATRSDINTLYARLSNGDNRMSELENSLNEVDVSLEDLKRNNEVSAAELGLSLSQTAKKLSSLGQSITKLDEATTSIKTKLEDETATLYATGEETKKSIQGLEDGLEEVKTDLQNSRQTGLRQDSYISALKQKIEFFEDDLDQQKTTINGNRAGVQSNKDLVNECQRQSNALKSKADNFDDSLEEITRSISLQTNSSFATQRTNAECNAKITSLEEKMQEHGAFIQRAEEAISKHNGDIHSMLLHSSNQTAALQMLKQRIQQENTAYLTRDLIHEMSNLERSIQIITNDVTILRAQDDAQKLANIEIQQDLSQIQTKAWKAESDVRQHLALIESMQEEMRSNKAEQGSLADTIYNEQNSIRKLQQDSLSQTNELTSLKDANTETSYKSGILEKSLRIISNKTRHIQSSINTLMYKVTTIERDSQTQQLAINGMEQRLSGQIAEADNHQVEYFELKAGVLRTESHVQQLKEKMKIIDEAKNTMSSRIDRIQSSVENFRENINLNKNSITQMYYEMNMTALNVNQIMASERKISQQTIENDRAVSVKMKQIQADVQRVDRSCQIAQKNASIVSNHLTSLEKHLNDLEATYEQNRNDTEREISKYVLKTTFDSSFSAVEDKIHQYEITSQTLEELSEKVDKTNTTLLAVAHHFKELETKYDNSMEQYIDRLQNQTNLIESVLRAFLSTPWTLSDVNGLTNATMDHGNMPHQEFELTNIQQKLQRILQDFKV